MKLIERTPCPHGRKGGHSTMTWKEQTQIFFGGGDPDVKYEPQNWCDGPTERELEIDYKTAQGIVYLTSRPMKILRRLPMFGRYYTLERLTRDIVNAALGLDTDGGDCNPNDGCMCGGDPEQDQSWMVDVSLPNYYTPLYISSTLAAYACGFCGAMVHDWLQHERWHEQESPAKHTVAS